MKRYCARGRWTSAVWACVYAFLLLGFNPNGLTPKALNPSWRNARLASSAEAEPRPDRKAEQQAITLFHDSEADYRAGRFREAADKLVAARKLLRKPVLTYNLARAYESLGDLPHAAEEYEHYLGEVGGDASDAGAIRARIASMRHTIEEQRSSDAQRLAAEESARRAERERQQAEAARALLADEAVRLRLQRGGGPGIGERAAAWTLFGAGVAGLVGGGVCAGLALRAHDRAGAGASQVDAVAADADSRRLALTANILLPVGGTLAVAGAIWGIVSEVHHRRALRRAKTPAGASLRPVVAPTVLGLSAGW